MSRTFLVCLCVSFSLCFVALFAIPVLASVQLSSTSINFGSVNINSSSAPSALVITNTGRHSVTLDSISSNFSQFVASGISLPMTLGPGASVHFSVTFHPNATQSYSGTIQIQFTARGGTGYDTVSVSGTGIQPLQPLITLTPGSAAFGSVTTGVTNTQTFTIANPGTANLAVTQVSISGAGFTSSGLALPLTIAPGASAPFTVGFTPTAATSFSGTLTVINNSLTPTVTAALSGTGVASSLQISAVPSALGFGEVAAGSSYTLTETLVNNGNANIGVNSDTVTGTGFSIAGLALPLTLTPGQMASFTVIFAPPAAATDTGNISIVSSASNSPMNISLSGYGVAPAPKVTLSWTPSSSSFSGFNVYRSATSGGPYTKIDSSLITLENYTDSNVTSGQTYYYVATEVDSSGNESDYSTQVSATIP